MIVIKTIGLTKEFVHSKGFKRQRCIAVNNFNLEVEAKEIFAFLGPNGAGKTTTINMLAGVISPTKGGIELFGQPFNYSNIQIKKKIGYLPESPQLPSYYHVSELLGFYSQIFDIPRRFQREKIDAVLEDVGILPQKNSLIENLSMGQRRCLGLAIALINDPSLLLLDEPTVYLDPIISEKIRTLLLRLKNQGSTIFISSHILSEVEKISDRFAIIHKGNLVQEGTVQHLADKGGLEELFLRITKKAKIPLIAFGIKI